MYQQISVSYPYFILIHQGLQPVEGRKNKAPWNQLKPGPGSSAGLYSEYRNTFYCEVIATRVYPKGIIDGLDLFDRYILGEELDKILPNVNTMEQARSVYLAFSTLEEIMEHGMVAIQLSVK